jgi:hypothetical protein
MTTALEKGEGSASRPGPSLPPGETRYPLHRRLGGPHGRSGQVQKTSPPPNGIRSQDRPARSQSLYPTTIPGPLSDDKHFVKLLLYIHTETRFYNRRKYTGFTINRRETFPNVITSLIPSYVTTPFTEFLFQRWLCLAIINKRKWDKN